MDLKVQLQGSANTVESLQPVWCMIVSLVVAQYTGTLSSCGTVAVSQLLHAMEAVREAESAVVEAAWKLRKLPWKLPC